jgi:DNA-binding MarR family transcriptional regulator
MGDVSKDLRRAMRVVEILREVAHHLPSQSAHLFLAIAAKPAQAMFEYAREIDISTSAGSRICQMLAEGIDGRDGYRLIQISSDPVDRRRTVVTLTPKGRALAERIAHAVR